MKILLQRVSGAQVRIDAETVGSIDRGLLLYVGFGRSDEAREVRAMSAKVVNLRVFPDQKGRFHYSVLDIQGDALLIPQFTLYGDTKRGRRPEFSRAMPPETASSLFELFVNEVSTTGISRVQSGRVGADMEVESINDGPVSIIVTNDQGSAPDRTS